MPCKLLFLLLISAASAHAQIKFPAASIYPSLTGYSSQQCDAFSFRSNAAALSGVAGFSVGLYSERRFLLQELSSHSLVAVIPMESGAFGVTADYYGSTAYNEALLGFGYSRKLSEGTSVGIGFQYNRLAAAGYGAASVIGFDAGARFRLAEGVHTGVAVHNPVGMRFGKSGDEKLAAEYSAGLGWDASPQLFIGGSLQKVENQSLSVNAGCQFVFAERLRARCGIASGTSSYYLGFGVKMKNLRLDFTASFHPTLGVTPGLQLLYSAKQ